MRSTSATRTALVALLLAGSGACASRAPAATAWAETSDSIVRAWVTAQRVPGAVVLLSRGGNVELFEAYGAAQLLEYAENAPRPLTSPVPMTRSTVFDLASVTKVMATTMALMLLVDRDVIDVDAPVSRYLTDFSGAGKEAVTVRQLLTHRSGLSQWQPVYYHAGTADEAYAWIRDFPLEWPPGEGRHYSDLGFMVLGRVVEAVSGQALDDFLAVNLYEPMELTSTGFRPEESAGPFASTSHGNPFERRMVHDADFGYEISGDPHAWAEWRTHTLRGEVNDGNSFHAFHGVAGHAGLFSTAEDLHALMQLMLARGSFRGTRFLAPEVIDMFLTDSGDGQALGWQMPAYAPPGSFGHTGFTGTFVLGVPDTGAVVILLTNRQNVGVDPTTSYPDVGPLQRAVTSLIQETTP